MPGCHSNLSTVMLMGSAREVPVVENQEVKVGWPLCVIPTISVDYRVSDGAESARSVQALAKYLEESLRLLV
jgi:pyruvate/2-oxoglutarate dehydrogenase complex dihydrolipoamide acyltransferase (E2) component